MTLCTNHACPMRDGCYTYRASPQATGGDYFWAHRFEPDAAGCCTGFEAIEGRATQATQDLDAKWSEHAG